MDKEQRIFVAGHRGMVGSAIVRKLQSAGYKKIVMRTRSELDLTNQAEVEAFFSDEAIDVVYLAAAKVGGIQANCSFPAEFIYQNLILECNIIHAAHLAGIRQLLFLGSSCIYPRMAQQPIPEEALLQGALEPTNEAYAVAKIAGIKLCEAYTRQYGHDYRSAMPTNLYGPNDNFHPANSHVVPALIRRFHEAKQSGEPEVVIWGTGKPMRELLHVEDMAAACIHLMELPRSNFETCTGPSVSHINIGTGVDCSIRELAEMIADVVDYKGSLVFDSRMPDGAPRKLLNVSRLQGLGWVASISLKAGLRDTYHWYVNSHESIG